MDIFQPYAKAKEKALMVLAGAMRTTKAAFAANMGL